VTAAARRTPVTRLAVRVIPRAGRDAIDGVRDGTLVVRVSAPPVGGAANAAVGRLVAEALGIPASRVSVISGTSGRHKVLGLEGLDGSAIVARWPDLGV
jgi:uncharacterized protein YggU (UPF0235/DUF167 family)